MSTRSFHYPLRVLRFLNLFFNSDVRVLCGLAAWLASCAGLAGDETTPRRSYDNPRHDPANWQWSVPTLVPGLIHGELHSAAMDRKVGYNIYLPPGYHEDVARRYPVVYYLHGATGTEKSDADFFRIADRLVRAGDIGEVIYIFPNGGAYSSYADWEDDYPKVETMIIEELIPHIDRSYRTLSSREGRAAMGYSMGGDGSLRFAMKHPDLFCAVASMAGAFGWGLGVQPEDSVFEWATTHADRLRGQLALKFVVGDEDRLLTRHHRLLAQLDDLKIDYHYSVHCGVGHNLGELAELSGEQIVRWLADQYTPALP